MDEEIIETTEESLEVIEETSADSWTYEVPEPDRLTVLQRQIQELSARLENRNEEQLDAYEQLRKDAAESAKNEIAPQIEALRDAIQAPAAIKRLVQAVAGDLDDSAKQFVEEYCVQQGATAGAINTLMANDKATMGLLRSAAIGASKKGGIGQRPAPKSSPAGEGGEIDTFDSDVMRSIERQAAAIAENIGCSYEDAKKQIEASYKEAAKNAK